MGNLVYIRTADGRRYEVAHLKIGSTPSYIKEGYKISKGELLGLSGTSGSLALGETPRHVHMQIRQKDGNITPTGLPGGETKNLMNYINKNIEKLERRENTS